MLGPWGPEAANELLDVAGPPGVDEVVFDVLLETWAVPGGPLELIGAPTVGGPLEEVPDGPCSGAEGPWGPP